MVRKKRQSKRTTFKDKYKALKKVTEHHRKQRREQRKAVREGRAPTAKKDPGLPNLMPYKEQFLRKAMEDKERERERERLRQRQLFEKRTQRDTDAMQDEYDDDAAMSEESPGKKRKRSGPSAEDLANASERSAAFEEKAEMDEDDSDDDGIKGNSSNKGKKRAYMKELRNVVDSADVILLVVDARDPMGCRAPQAEQMVLENARNKRLVVVMNKIDLVPKQVAERWLTELRKEYPTVAFRASTQEQKANLGRANKDSIALGAASTGDEGTYGSVGDGVCVGADTLLQLLKNYSRNHNIKTSITVGVVGYPNVGKSSVINSLKRCRAVGVSPTPGFTKTLQIVQLDKKVKLIDSPGVLFQDSTQTKDSARLILRNCLNPADIDDVVEPISKLVERCNKETLMILYRVPRFATPTEFIVAVAKKRGKLSKGGVPDQKAAARLILQDLNAGKIPFYVVPPKQGRSLEDKILSRENTKVTSEWAKEFDIEALLAKEQSELVERLPGADPNALSFSAMSF